MKYRRLSPIRILALIGVLIGIAAAGTVGFIILENQSPLAGFLTTLNLLSTVGMGEMPASLGGQLLAVFRSEERRVGKEFRSRLSPYH